MTRYVRFFIMVCILASCSNSSRDDLARQYQSRVRDLGLFPVYPPREEFQLGDVYYWSRSASNPDDFETVWVTSLPWIEDEAERFLRSRIVFKESDANNNAQAEDLLGPGLRRRAEESIMSLPISAFPEITADAGFVAGAGIGRVFSALGFSGGNRTTVTLNFNDVRTYWVPNVQVASRVEQELPQQLAFLHTEADKQVRRLLQVRRGQQTEPCGDGRVCGYSVVTRVYLTRTITYTYRSAEILAAARSRFQTAPDASGQPPALPSINVTVSGSSGEPGDVLQTQIDALRSEVDALAKSGGTGESLAFQSWDAAGLRFSQTFLRPVAIGWDGFDYQLEEG